MKTVLLTGGARGIGKGIAAEFAADHNVAITYNSTAPDALLAVCPDVHAVQSDLSAPGSAVQVIDAVLSQFSAIDVLINNADALLTDEEDTGLNQSVNVRAPMALLSAALPHLQRGACVINISSVNAVLPAKGAASYSASKAALNTWTRAMAKELGPKGIRVNAIAPGAIERSESPRPPELVQSFTDMTALARVGTPEDIAPVARFLASDAAGFITGEILTVSGGYRL